MAKTPTATGNNSKWLTLRDELRKFFKEKDEEIDGLLVALLSRQHVLLIGPKGTAKSLLIRTLKKVIKGAKYFERLLTKFTVPDELFGPVKLSALKNDKFERAIEGKLPTVHLAFIDEIWKANSSILNALLTLINERLFHNDGTVVQCPLETMLAASNELPQDESLSALYDRFLLRFKTRYIEERSNFAAMVVSKTPNISVILTFDEVHQAQQAAAAVDIMQSIIDAVCEIRERLKKEGVIPSDRRFKEAVSTIQAHAWLNGRSVATEDDLGVLRHVLWDEPTHIGTVERVILEVSNPLQRKADELFDAIQSAMKNVDEQQKPGEKTLAAGEALAKIKDAKVKVEEIRAKMVAEKRDTRKVDEQMKTTDDIVQRRILKEVLGLTR